MHIARMHIAHMRSHVLSLSLQTVLYTVHHENCVPRVRGYTCLHVSRLLLTTGNYMVLHDSTWKFKNRDGDTEILALLIGVSCLSGGKDGMDHRNAPDRRRPWKPP
jgi:hypothetical protein